ncbi:MAG: dihydroorotate dehydrogenase electron transfer subunit [Candidatus Komeilibacteria bacterium]|nr:dihydroorotate dehydrogenase electron transfer subunit [Candidatus Komeilibacteria bacterium]
MDKITQPTIVKITKIINEGLNYKTFVFNYPLEARAGQYLMLWLPGEDLKPFAVAWKTPDKFALAVLKRGDFTAKLFEAHVGDLLGFTGPHGTYYNLTGRKKILLIGGGSGAPSVTFLAQEAGQQNIKVDFVLAAAAKEEIIFESWLTAQGVKVYHRFQDKKYEHAWDLITDLINKNNYDGLFACGPELLLKKIVDLSLEKNIFCQVSLERYIKCGIGVCGKCCVDNSGLCLCQAGPVVNNHLANQISEFGKYHRDGSGQKIYFKQ